MASLDSASGHPDVEPTDFETCWRMMVDMYQREEERGQQERGEQEQSAQEQQSSSSRGEPQEHTDTIQRGQTGGSQQGTAKNKDTNHVGCTEKEKQDPEAGVIENKDPENGEIEMKDPETGVTEKKALTQENGATETKDLERGAMEKEDPVQENGVGRKDLEQEIEDKMETVDSK